MSNRDLKLSKRGSTFKEYQSPRPRGSEARAAAEADRLKPWLDQSASKSRPGVRRNCTTCGHDWVDRYNKDECPKCLSCISNPFKRIVGEVGKTKQPPTSAMVCHSPAPNHTHQTGRDHAFHLTTASACPTVLPSQIMP